VTSHRETAYKEECKGVELPLSENAADNSIIIPLYVPMQEDEVEIIQNAIKSCFF
jgi:dTDP-4-amino-4,6-dideoxygalactose transaminase